MKNLFFTFLLCAAIGPFAIAQNKTQPAPKPAPKGPPPYVLKKDFEPIVADLQSKIAAAQQTAASVRRSVDGRFDQLTQIDSQLTAIQEVLNSASFQIAMNADSLKETRYSVESLDRKLTEQLATIIDQQQKDRSQSLLFLIIALGASVVLFGIVLWLLFNKLSVLAKQLHQNEQVLKSNLASTTERLQKELKAELQGTESRMLQDISMVKRELSAPLPALQQQLQTIESRLIAIEEAKTDSNSDTII
ncbi:MAG: hypothetical protein MUE96_04355 [Bacteroidia bacterium]|jgi:hypothetical protein|nr:hypothetical protein [Bacteroidia bacterium]